MGKPLVYPRDKLPGRTRPYRPLPPDFAKQYIRLGWDEIEAHYNTNWRCIARWIDESGGDKLRAKRRAHVKEQGRRMLHSAG